LVDQLAEWKLTYGAKPKVVAMIDQILLPLLKDLQDPKKPQAKALMQVIDAFKERKNERAQAKTGPKTKAGAVADPVKKADDQVVKSIGSTAKDESVQTLVRQLNNLMFEIGPAGLGLFNIAPYGRQLRPSGSLQAHHIIQNDWAKATIAAERGDRPAIRKYSESEAPSILLERTNVRHSIINTRQQERRHDRVNQGLPKWSTSLEDEFKNARSDLQAAGVPEDVINKAIEAARRYFESLSQ